MPKYLWADGSRVKVAAEVVGGVLDDISARNNDRVTPRMVVDEARPEQSPIHPCFEWDDLRAAELFREDQARYVLRSIRVVREDEDADTPSEVMHAYVSVVESQDGKATTSFVPISLALSESSLREQLIRQAMKELDAFERKYRTVVRLSSIFSEAKSRAGALLSEMSATV